jgi:hypothetical protein
VFYQSFAGGIHRCDFNRQQTGDSIGKFVSNLLRNQNVWFCRPVKSDQEDIHQNDYAIGGSERI